MKITGRSEKPVFFSTKKLTIYMNRKCYSHGDHSSLMVVCLIRLSKQRSNVSIKYHIQMKNVAYFIRRGC